MQQCAPPQGSTLLIVPQCLAAARGRGFDSDGCDALPVAAILQWHPLWPKLWRLVFTQHWTKIRTMFTMSELLLYRHVQDHRLLTRDILGYPSSFSDILG